MSHLFKKTHWSLLTLALTALIIVAGCNKDDDEDDTSTDAPIASFQFEIDETNFLQVTFTNFSQNASTYAWDFGDGNTSTEENPVHTYTEADTYTVVLVATSEDGQTDDREETVTITDPAASATFLSGTGSKTWYLLREGVALGIGPSMGNNEFFSFGEGPNGSGGNSVALGDRPCILDDAYTFNSDGTFENNTNGTLYVDGTGNGGWIDGNEGNCFDEDGNLTAFDGTDLSAFAGGGAYTYTFDETNLVISGLGAYIGLANKTTGGDNFVPEGEKNYTVFGLHDGETVDSLNIALVGADFAWNFYLVSYENEADLPAIPASVPTAGFSFIANDLEVTFSNSSINATSYMWDFGDGNTSTEENPVHTYADFGEYQVSLTAMDDAGGSDMIMQPVILSSAEFTAAALSSAEGKVWKIALTNSYVVGPAPGNGEFFAESIGSNPAKACELEHEFVFFDDGTFEFRANGEVFDHDFISNTGVCIDEGAIPSPYEALGSGTHSFSVTEGDPNTVTVTGTGAYIGFAKGFNGGELNLGAGTPLPSSITYQVFDYTSVATGETIAVAVDIAGDGSAWWSMRLVTAE